MRSKVLILKLKAFLTNTVNKAYTFFIMKMVSVKRPKDQHKRILDHSFLFTIQNVASGYTLCHLENWFFHFYVSLKSFHGRA